LIYDFVVPHHVVLLRRCVFVLPQAAVYFRRLAATLAAAVPIKPPDAEGGNLGQNNLE
jgi:hypothetical protein